MVKPYWKTLLGGAGNWRSRGDGNRRGGDRRIWHNSGHHFSGEFSMAMVQANAYLEDQARLESGPLSYLQSGPYGTFVGVYDGHGGPEASRYVNERMFDNLKRFASENQEMSADVIRRAFFATEDEFLSVAREQWCDKPQMASVGTCCLVAVICEGSLYVANAGDSRAVMGRVDEDGEIRAVQLSVDHNAKEESIRDELQALHPNDPQIVVLKHKVWRVKGLIQVSRSIGDAYLKCPEFNREPLPAKFRVPEPFERPILSPEPSIVVHEVECEDQFVILASDGLWEHLSNEEAIDIVCSHPRRGIAGRLVEAALRVAARKREMRFSDMKKIEPGVRRHFHDDITAVVVFMDGSCGGSYGGAVSVRGGEDVFCSGDL
ncbi:probable protein phosphatase 2C 38 [Andrographis paniculata]|uniref:probable protein phosphatase 2C 38 n=1 Tax=Andrographis paniculata TaxID=175694 RepID=UPI0021E8D529|nr:probable protein phosphatase 2C 38 [Andrographis paniculata]XP_051132314.1 probable protein phosphatase 2C 38 [Andrographis paniculata]XP_051132315.1 probable protein phosphatase 2C 38 [Andrographis paniculata]XP_051132316.1 probable protein phosphatase 2C 38 [Andrographis paniculata]XP_051132317.1 probable protein phosphatase 2C 38 [Andrographis paniculata]